MEACACASTSASYELTEPEARSVWDSVTRCLMRIGKVGVQDTHVRSLADLLAAHTLVKVQLNGAAGSQPELQREAAEKLASGAGAALLQTKGCTLLFASAAAPKAEVLKSAAEELKKTEVWRAKKQDRRQRQAQDRIEDRRSAGRSAGSSSNSSKPAKVAGRATAGRQQLHGMISQSVRPGPITKDSLREEWQNLATKIVEVEQQEARGVKGTPATGGRKKSKAPWKQ